MPKRHRPASRRQIATPMEIVDFLDRWYAQVRDCIAANRTFRAPIALGTPKLCAFVTESFAVYLVNHGYLRSLLPEVYQATLARGAGGEPDVALTRRDGSSATLEVKSTGPTTWQRASAKDAAADYFVWINLGPFCEGTGTARVWVLREPHRYLRQGLDWRSEKEFVRRTEKDVMCLEIHVAALLAQRAA